MFVSFDINLNLFCIFKYEVTHFLFVGYKAAKWSLSSCFIEATIETVTTA